MSKTVSARISNETHKKLLEKCNKLGCSVNEYLNNHIESIVQNSSDKINTKSDIEPKEDYEVIIYDEKEKFDDNGLIGVSENVWKNKDGLTITKIKDIE